MIKQKHTMFEAASSLYVVITSWLTPSCLFIFINLVIGTIAVASRFATQRSQQQQRRAGDSPGQLGRSSSLLDRVMSFNLGHYKFQPPTQPEFVTDPVQENRDSPRLARAPSLLDRVKSLNLGLCKTENKQADPKSDNPTRGELTRTPSLLERLKSMKFYRSGSINEEKEGREPEPDVTGNGSGWEHLRNSRRWEEEELLDEEVDKKAHDFINRFRRQLRLQRLDSILRYRDVPQGNWSENGVKQLYFDSCMCNV